METIIKELNEKIKLEDLNEKQQILDAVLATEREDILIGLDTEDIIKLFKNSSLIHIGRTLTKNATEVVEIIESLLLGNHTELSVCDSVYLYIKGDISLMTTNDVVKGLENYLGEDVKIIFTATYDEHLKDEYVVIAFFFK